MCNLSPHALCVFYDFLTSKKVRRSKQVRYGVISIHTPIRSAEYVHRVPMAFDQRRGTKLAKFYRFRRRLSKICDQCRKFFVTVLVGQWQASDGRFAKKCTDPGVDADLYNPVISSTHVCIGQTISDSTLHAASMEYKRHLCLRSWNVFPQSYGFGALFASDQQGKYTSVRYIQHSIGCGNCSTLLLFHISRQVSPILSIQQ